MTNPPSAEDALDQARAVIRAEAHALELLAGSLDRAFNLAVSCLWVCRGKVIVTGMGKAGLIARKIAATFQSTGTPAAFLCPAAAAHGDMGMICDQDLLLALSNSGETDEVLHVARYCQDRAVDIAVVTSHPESALAKLAKITVSLPAVPEGCPIGKAPMASTAMMMALGDAFAARLMQMRSFTAEDFLRLHHGGYLGRQMRAVA